MKNSLRNKPCLCGSNKKMKKCCGDNTQTTYENSELGKETFKKWGGEISNELGMMNTYEIIEEMNPYFFPKTERIGLVSDEVLVSLDRRWYEDVQRVCWNLETIRIKSDKRGHGIGEKVMSVILKISKKYKCPLTLTPQEIDLSKNTKTTSVNFLELVKTNEDVKKHFSKRFFASSFESFTTETIPDVCSNCITVFASWFTIPTLSDRTKIPSNIVLS